MPPKMPFKYAHAPLLARNGDGRTDFPGVRRHASSTRWGKTKVELGLSSRIRSLAEPLPAKLADEVVENYERLRAAAPRSHIALTYEEALPWLPPLVDRDREKSHQRFLAKLGHFGGDGKRSFIHHGVPPEAGSRRCCGMSRCRTRGRCTRRCRRPAGGLVTSRRRTNDRR